LFFEPIRAPGLIKDIDINLFYPASTQDFSPNLILEILDMGQALVVNTG
jgi:hypothetical protein